MTGSVVSGIRRLLTHLRAPFSHDPAWFEVMSIMGAVGWSGIGLLSSYRFEDWPSMRFVTPYVGDGPLFLAMALGLAQGAALFCWCPEHWKLRARMVLAFSMSWWWGFVAGGVATSLPSLSPHVALYVVLSMLNLVTMVRLMREAPRLDTAARLKVGGRDG